MKALILAAGFCTRLQPLTTNFPKGLLPVGGKAIVQYIMDQIVDSPKLSHIALVTNHRYANTFALWLQKTYPDKKIQLLDDGASLPENRLGAIGDILFSLEKLGWNDDILVLSSDTLVSATMQSFLTWYETHHGVGMMVYKTDDLTRISKKLGCAILDQEKLVSFVEKPEHPPSPYIGVPFYIFPKEMLPMISDYKNSGGPLDAPGSILSYFIGKVPTYAFDVGVGYYHDVGTIEIYNALVDSFHP